MMDLADNQFLKIKTTNGGNIYLEIYEQPFDKWRRPLRWSLIISPMRIVNRRTIDSKLSLFVELFANLHYAFLEEFHPEELVRIFRITNFCKCGHWKAKHTYDGNGGCNEFQCYCDKFETLQS